MSSKLVKKLLLQTTNNSSSLTSNNDGDYDSGTYQDRSRKRKYKSSTITNTPTALINEVVTKEDMINEHVQSLLRLDNLSQQYSSGTAHKSFDRLSSNMKQQAKERKMASKSIISNSRSNSSSFTQKPHESRFDEKRDKVEKEEKYYGDLARALRKASKKKDKKSSSSSNKTKKQKVIS